MAVVSLVVGYIGGAILGAYFGYTWLFIFLIAAGMFGWIQFVMWKARKMRQLSGTMSRLGRR